MSRTLSERVAALEERSIARDIEMRDVKKLFEKMDHKLDLLVDRDNQQRGAMTLGKAIAGTGVFGAIIAILGTFAVTLWQRFVSG